MHEKAQIDFILELLRKGIPRKDILASFGKQWPKVSVRTFDRRLRDAEQMLIDERKRIKEEADALVTSAINQRAEKILDSYERQVLLSKIALGEVEIASKEPRYDPMQRKFVMVPVVQPPSIGDRLRAMAELNKMDGSHQTNIDITSGGKPLPKLIVPALNADNS